MVAMTFVLRTLDEVEPCLEYDLRRIGQSQGIHPEDLADAVNLLLSDNAIRWVAFRGYCKGGRPL